LLLDKTCKEYKKKVEEDKTLLATVIAQLLYNKKILKQVNKHARQKALCIANKIAKAGKLNLAEKVNCPAALISICALLATWGVLSLIKESVANYSTCVLISDNL
jgi:hypothetical protein